VRKRKQTRSGRPGDRAEELIFNTSSEHQTVNLSNKCMTKDFLSFGVHTTVFLRTLEDITDLPEFETRIFLDYPPKPCGPNPF
jgi:hypothetical protein